MCTLYTDIEEITLGEWEEKNRLFIGIAYCLSFIWLFLMIHSWLKNILGLDTKKEKIIYRGDEDII